MMPTPHLIHTYNTKPFLCYSYKIHTTTFIIQHYAFALTNYAMFPHAAPLNRSVARDLASTKRSLGTCLVYYNLHQGTSMHNGGWLLHFNLTVASLEKTYSFANEC
jgi:hypothetical protein